MGRLIETDMALASAVLRTVNSAMFGITRRVETVHEAVRYLGMSEVAAVTYQMGLRSVFPSTPSWRTWSEAPRRSLFMGRMANLLRLDPGWPTRRACSKIAARPCWSASTQSTAPCCRSTREAASAGEDGDDALRRRP